MSAAEVSNMAHHLVATKGAQARAEAAQKAASFESAGDKEQAAFWRRVEAVISEIRGPRES